MDTFKEKGSKAAETLGSKFSKLGKVVATAFSVVAITNMTKKMVEASAKLQAMDAQFSQVFKGGEAEKALKSISKQSKELGVHSDRLTVSWNKFGAQVKGAGMDSGKALSATEKATKLAADAAAFYDISLEDATASISSFMKGNMAAGDAIGVFTKVSRQNEEALKMYGKEWKELTEAEQQFLQLSTIEKTFDLSGAAGQAAREMDGWENVVGNLKATWTRFLSVIGAPVLKVVVQIVQGITEGIAELTERLKKSGKESKAFANIWKDVGKPIFDALVEVLFVVMKALKTILPFIAKVMKKIGEFDFKSVFGNKVTSLIDDFKDKIRVLAEFFINNLPEIKRIAIDVFGSLEKAFETAVYIISSLWETVGKPVFNWFVDNLPIIKDNAVKVFGELKDGFEKALVVIKDVWEKVAQPVFEGFMSIVEMLLEKWNENFPAIQEGWQIFSATVDELYNKFIKPAMESFGEAAEGSLKFFGEALGVVIDYIADFQEDGNLFLPTLLGIIGAFVAWKTILGIQALISGISTAIGFLTAITSGQTIAQWALNAAMLANPLTWIVLAIGAVIAIGVLLWKNWDTIKEKTALLWQAMKERFTAIGEAIKAPFVTAVNFIKEQIEKIKGFFSGLSLKLPKIKMPHFKLSGSFSLAPPSIPKLDVEWRAKGGYMPRATLFGQSGDKVQGGGEAGGEGIVPLEGKHMFPLADAVANRLSDRDRSVVNNITINATIREEADIRKITKAITDETKRAERTRGRF